MATNIIIDKELVFHFLGTHGVPLNISSGMQGIGLIKDDELIAGVMFDDYNGSNMWMHVAAVPGRRWMTRDFLYATFAYPFLQLNIRRLSGWVEADNIDARRFDEHIGFKQEAVLKQAGRNGVDVIIYSMFKEDCRFIKGK